MDEKPREKVKARFGRRMFIGFLVAGALGLVVSRELASKISGLFDSMSLGERNPARGVSPDSGIPRPRGKFRIYTVNGIPEFNPATWRFTVDGLVETPVSLSYNEVLKLPKDSQVSDFQCVTGWQVWDVHWEGIRIKTFLEMVKPKPEAHYIKLYSSDGVYTESLSLEDALVPDVLLAYRMVGDTLPEEQGMPLRLVAPKMYGYKSIKWVHRLELMDKVHYGYWEVRGYPDDATIRPENPFDIFI